MKSKNISLMLAGVLALAFMVSLASATLQFTPTSFTKEIAQSSSSTFDFNVANDVLNDFTDLSYSITGFTDGLNSIPSSSFDLTLPSSIAGNSNEDLSLEVSISASQVAGSYEGELVISGKYGATDYDYSLPITINVPEPVPDWRDDFCAWDNGDVRSIENQGDLRVEIDSLKVSGLGDDNEWLPFDEVEVTVTIDNRGNWDTDNVEVEWGLYDEDTDEWVIEVDNEKEFDLREGKDDSVTFTFTIDDKMDIDLEDLEDGSHYTLYARATGELAEGDYESNDTCDADSESIELIIERDYVILDNLEYPETVQCNADFQLSADVWNIGSRDQDEVSVFITNSELGINKDVVIGDINSFDKDSLDFTFKIPNDVDEKTYTIKVGVYDEDEDVYVNDYNDDESSYSLTVDVSGSCSGSPVPTEDVLVRADLVSGGKAGEPLIVRASVTNAGEKRIVLSVDPSGYSQWAVSGVADPNTLDLDSGESGEVMFTFNVNKDASGENLFDIEVLSDGELVASQPVSVSIEPKSSGLSSLFGDNSLIWIFVLVDIILIAIIVVVAMRVARK